MIDCAVAQFFQSVVFGGMVMEFFRLADPYHIYGIRNLITSFII